jgi:hypothetical protein
MERYVIKAMKKDSKGFVRNAGSVTVRMGERDDFISMMKKTEDMRNSGMYKWVSLYKVITTYVEVDVPTSERPFGQMKLC